MGLLSWDVTIRNMSYDSQDVYHYYYNQLNVRCPLTGMFTLEYHYAVDISVKKSSYVTLNVDYRNFVYVNSVRQTWSKTGDYSIQITEDTTIEISPASFTIEGQGSYCTVTPKKVESAHVGDKITFTAVPNTGYEVDYWADYYSPSKHEDLGSLTHTHNVVDASKGATIVTCYAKEKVVYTAKFYTWDDHTAAENKKAYAGGKINMPSLPARDDTNVEGECKLYLDNGTTIKQTYNYVIQHNKDAWRLDSHTGERVIDSTWTMNKNCNFYAGYKDVTGEIVLPSIGNLPTPGNKTGYKFDHWEYTDGDKKGQTINPNDVFTQTELHGKAIYVAEEYDISYSLSYTTGREENDVEKWADGAPDSVKVSYGSKTFRTSNKKSVYRGHTDQKWINSERTNEFALNTIYEVNSTNGLYNNGSNLTLFTKWSPIQHAVYTYYATGVSGGKGTGVKEVKNEYNIDDWYKNSHKFITIPAPKNVSFGDYVFYGWTNVEPGSWKITHGLYKSPVELEADIAKYNYRKITVPYVIEQLNEKSSTDIWGISTANINRADFYDDRYAPLKLYGLWVVSGKYIYLNGKWNKVDTAYIYKSNGGWTDITDMNVRVDGKWKTEVGH